MQIIIIGAGLVGTSLADHLLRQDHDIAIVEQDQARCDKISEKLDVLMVRGLGSSPRDLERAGIANADMVIAATPIDEVNIISCMIARQYGVQHRIARIRNWDFIEDAAKIKPEDFGITRVIYPEENTINAVLNYIETPFAIDAQDFQDRKVLLRSYVITEDMPIANKTLVELRSDPAGKMLLVVAIIRGIEVFIPRGEATLLPGDKPLFIFPRESLDHFLSLVGIPKNAKRKVVIYGNTLTAVNIARALKKQVDSIVFIDPDRAHGNIAAAQLANVDVLHGDGDDVDVLREANIRFADFFIAAAKHNDENVLSCLLAKSEGAREVMAIISDDQHTDLFQSIGINHVIKPRQLTANGILNVIHPGFVGTSLHIQKTDIDVLRFRISDAAPIAGQALKDSWRKAHGLGIVGAVIRQGEMIVPTGDTMLLADDLVIVFTRTAGIKQVKKLFGAL